MCDHMLSVSLMGLGGNLHMYFFNEVMQQELNLYCESACRITFMDEVCSFMQNHSEWHWIHDWLMNFTSFCDCELLNVSVLLNIFRIKSDGEIKAELREAAMATSDTSDEKSTDENISDGKSDTSDPK